MEQSDRVEKKVVNNFFGNINNFFAAPVTYNAPVTNIANDERKSEAQEGYTDEQVAAAIEAICGDGKPLDTKQKWAAVYWYLRWQCNYPVKGSEFCERIEHLPFTKKPEPMCSYENIRKLLTLSFMNQDARQLDSVKPSKLDESFFAEIRTVVLAFAQELSKTALPKR